MTRIALVLAILLAPAALAQDVWIVDAAGGAGADFLEVQDAVDAAADGDVVLVRPGAYDFFVVDGKSLFVHGDGAGVSMLGPLVVRNLPESGRVTVRGIDIERLMPQSFPFTFTKTLLVEDCAGPVWFEQVRTNTNPPPLPPPLPGNAPAPYGAVVEDSASVVFTRCELVAIDQDPVVSLPATGLEVSGSNVALFDCLVRGGLDHSPLGQTFSGSDAIRIDGGSLSLSGCDVAGSDGLDGSTTVTCQACAGGDAGAGVVASGAGPSVRTLGSTIAAGAAGATGFCSGSPCGGGAGALSIDLQAGTLTEFSGAARRTVLSSPVRDGQTVTETWIGEPGDLIVMVLSVQPSTVYVVPGILGTNVLGLPFFSRLQGFVGAGGSKIRNVTIQDAVPAQSAIGIYKQSLFIDASLDVFSSGPSALLLVDDAF